MSQTKDVNGGLESSPPRSGGTVGSSADLPGLPRMPAPSLAFDRTILAAAVVLTAMLFTAREAYDRALQLEPGQPAATAGLAKLAPAPAA